MPYIIICYVAVLILKVELFSVGHDHQIIAKYIDVNAYLEMFT